MLVLLLMANIAQAQSGFANGLHYEVAGSGHPLVLIHGGQLDSRMWDDQYAAVLVAPGLSGFHFSGDPNDAASWRAAQAGDWETVAHYWLIGGYMAPAMEKPKIAPRIHQLALENAHQNLDNAALERVLDPPAIDRLPSIHIPTLIIVGGAGHMVNMEKPAEFDRAVLSFLGSR